MIFCPSCGKKVVLRSAADLPRTEQKFMVVPTVAAGCLVLTKWCVERRQFVGGERLYKNTYEAYIVDGGCAVKLAHYKRGLYWNMLRLEEWKQNKRFEDRLTCPYFMMVQKGGPAWTARRWKTPSCGSTWTRATKRTISTRWRICGCMRSTSRWRT